MNFLNVKRVIVVRLKHILFSTYKTTQLTAAQLDQFHREHFVCIYGMSY